MCVEPLLSLPPQLHKDDMQKALQSMYQKKKYKQMVIYMEACESGSMFDSLPTDLNSEFSCVHSTK